MMPNNLRSALILSLSCLLAAGCGGTAMSGDANTTTDTSTTGPMQFQRISAPSSAIESPRLVVVRDAAAWDNLWRENVANQVPAPATPVVDFTKNMVIGVFLGSRPNGCYHVAVQSVVRRAGPDRIEVNYRATVPTAQTMCTAVITNPSDLVIVPSSPLPVNFIQVS